MVEAARRADMLEVGARFERGDVRLGGITRARLVGGEDGRSYVCKSVRFPEEPLPYLLANEAIAANLATLLGLPVQEWRVVVFRGERLFGSLYEPSLLDPRLVQLTSDTVDNIRDVPAILVFDIFICNPDRHLWNSIVLRSTGRRGRVQIRLFDHSHALMGASTAPEAALDERPSVRSYLTCWDFNVLIRDPREFDPPLAAVDRLTKDDLEEAVTTLPREWLPQYTANVPRIVSALTRRQARMRSLVRDVLAEEERRPPVEYLFPHMMP